MSNGHIFISYRRDDSAGYTRAIYDQLVKRFSKDRIFMDVDAIEPGLPFDEVINQAVGRCEILLAMIGKRWLEQQAGVGPRVNDPKDFVRIEIAAALSRNIRVIPILLDGASMPSEEALPEPLHALARRNAIEVSNSRFNADVDRLVEAVSKALGEAEAPRNQQVPRSRRSIVYWLLVGLAAVGIVPVVRFVIPRMSGETRNNQPWTSIVKTPNGTLFYNAHSGTAAFEYFDASDNRKISKTYPVGTVTPNWTHIVDTPKGLLFYNTDTGAAVVGKIDNVGNYTVVKKYPPNQYGSFAPGWTSIVYTSEGIWYKNDQTGAENVGRLDEFGNHVTIR